MNKIFTLFLIILIFVYSCDFLETQPTEEEVVQGLKTALQVGTDTTCQDLSQTDAYYKNTEIKIDLPEEAKFLYDAINSPEVRTLGLDSLLNSEVEKVILSLNRTAENLADDAKPIFFNAISDMTIEDGMSILNGENSLTPEPGFDSLAATHYLEFKTRNDLFATYKPYIDETLKKDLGLGFSAYDAWNELVALNNTYLVPLGYSPINTDITDYTTQKALDGLFLFIGVQEKKIRENPYAYSQEIIQKVFGYVYEEQQNN